jgi:hypothetical protein
MSPARLYVDFCLQTRAGVQPPEVIGLMQRSPEVASQEVDHDNEWKERWRRPRKRESKIKGNRNGREDRFYQLPEASEET